MKYSQAKEIAIRVYKALQPWCERIEIAGSVRREKADVHDIELVCDPAVILQNDMFGEVLAKQRVAGFLNAVRAQGKIIKGDIASGRFVQVELPEGIVLDLFMPQSFDFYRQLAIRTGSADYSHKVIATAWIKKGYVGTENGLRLASECYAKDLGDGKKKWICNNPNPTLTPVFQNEYEFFKWLGLEWLSPNKRI